MIVGMRTAVLGIGCLLLAGCWKTIHEASAPAGDPVRRPAVCDARPAR